MLVTGGDNNQGQRIANAEIYDPATGLWTMTGHLKTARLLHSASLLPDGSVLVAGGISASITALASLEDYNPVTGRWRLLDGSLHFARYSQTTVTLLDGNLLIAGGGAYAAGNPPAAELIVPRQP